MGIARRHYCEDLDVDIDEATAAVASNLFPAVTSECPDAAAAAIFCLKRLPSWNEKVRVELDADLSNALRWAPEADAVTYPVQGAQISLLKLRSCSRS